MTGETAIPTSANGHASGSASSTLIDPPDGTMSSRHHSSPTNNHKEETNNDSDSDLDWREASYVSKAQLSYDATLLPGGARSLSSIAMQAFWLGFVLAGSIASTLWLHFVRPHPLWRLPAFLVCLSIFHFLEFWTTARFNAPACRASSFLLYNNGRAYNVANLAAMLEIVVSSVFWPDQDRYPTLPLFNTGGVSISFILGLALVLLGQTTRSIAMAQAGTNFNHTPQKTKRDDHTLVTRGVYSLLRHPSYFGFFWWAIGTQLLVGNRVCLAGYAVVLWRFFDGRIRAEEKTLVQFFGTDYEEFRRRTRTGIPFVR